MKYCRENNDTIWAKNYIYLFLIIFIYLFIFPIFTLYSPFLTTPELGCKDAKDMSHGDTSDMYLRYSNVFLLHNTFLHIHM